jgi:Flp pilus assembly protein TadD
MSVVAGRASAARTKRVRRSIRRFVQLVAVAVLATAVLPACAARSRATATVPPSAVAPPAPESSLGEYISKIRHLSTTARPVPKTKTMSVPTLESRDRALAAALAHLRVEPSAEAYLAVGEEYRSHGVLDSAYKHFNAAVRLDPRNADAYEGLARTWRDWGLPALALSDASRARFYAPASASVHNTLGTILQALGRPLDARQAYERALTLESHATYAMSNLCYLSFLEGQMERAIDECRRAVALDPALKSAHYNLALAYAGTGAMDRARQSLAAAGDAAEASFNLGILHMARRDYRGAAAAFDAASRARPTMNIARERALHARVLARTASANPVGPEGENK